MTQDSKCHMAPCDAACHRLSHVPARKRRANSLCHMAQVFNLPHGASCCHKALQLLTSSAQAPGFRASLAARPFFVPNIQPGALIRRSIRPHGPICLCATSLQLQLPFQFMLWGVAGGRSIHLSAQPPHPPHPPTHPAWARRWLQEASPMRAQPAI